MLWGLTITINEKERIICRVRMEQVLVAKAREKDRAAGDVIPRKKERDKAIKEATIHAIRIPFEVMQTAFAGYEVTEAMIREGNPNSITDAGVGALAIHASIQGAFLNVRINASDVKNDPEVQSIVKEGEAIIGKSLAVQQQLLGLVSKAFDSQ